MERKRNMQTDQTKKNPLRKRKTSFVMELLILTCLTLAFSVLSPIFNFLNPFSFPVGEILKVSYSENLFFQVDKGILMNSLIMGFINILLFLLVLAFLRPSGIRPDLSRKRNTVSLIILSVFGYLAYIVLSVILASFLSAHVFLSLMAASILTDIYEILIYKLYYEDKSESNALFWEIFRFAIVGLVAAVFDFLACYLVQFICFKGNTSGYVTVIATGCGFLIGVIINYVMSTYMVYKASKSNFSKSFKGIFLFVILSFLGMVIGMVIQTFLYDYLFAKKGMTMFSYPVDFVIRTLIVMVYNYVSRKLIIYRK